MKSISRLSCGSYLAILATGCIGLIGLTHPPAFAGVSGSSSTAPSASSSPGGSSKTTTKDSKSTTSTRPQKAVPAAANSTRAVSVLKYKIQVPTSWKEEKPDTDFRLVQFKLPGIKDRGDAEFVVFYFGKDSGGPVDANIMRWTSQFSSPDGTMVHPKVDRFTVRGIHLTTVVLKGSYARGVGMGPVGKAVPDQTLLVAVFETPEGNLTFQLHGHKDTMDNYRDAFSDAVLSFK